MRRLALLTVPLVLHLASSGEARTWVVTVDGQGDAPTIQAAIDSAATGDDIVVHPGTYFENIDFLGKDVHLRSQSGPESTIIDGSQVEFTVVSFDSGEGRGAILEGFTIQGGVGKWFPDLEAAAGGGVRIQDSSPVVRGNIIRDNDSGWGWGGGLMMDTSRDDIPQVSPLILDNLFENNTAQRNGAGIAAFGVRTRIEGNVFRGNRAMYDGGGIYVAMDGEGSIEIRDNQFWDNYAGDHGGAIEFGQQGRAAPALVENNLFVRNEAHGLDVPTIDNGTGGGVAMRGWSGTIRNNTFVQNKGTGQGDCTGGAILLSAGPRPVLVENNLIYASEGCAIVCRPVTGASGTTIRNNLFWENTPGDIDAPPGCDIGLVEDNLFETDPLLCGPEMDNFTVAINSPALLASPPIGVWLHPGCGEGVPVQRTTWGRIKTRFSNE